MVVHVLDCRMAMEKPSSVCLLSRRLSFISMDSEDISQGIVVDTTWLHYCVALPYELAN